MRPVHHPLLSPLGSLVCCLALLIGCASGTTPDNGDASNNGATSTNNGTTSSNSGTGTNNGTTSPNNGGTTSTNSGTTSTNNATTSTNNSTTSTNNNTTSTNNATTSTNNGTTSTNNGTTSTNNGTTSTNNGTTSTNNGTTSTNNGTTSTNNGTTGTNNADPCVVDADCDEGELCLDGAFCEAADCRISEDCPSAGQVCDANLCVLGEAPEVLALELVPERVVAGSEVTLTWQVARADNVTLLAEPTPEGWVEDVAAEGSRAWIAQEGTTILLDAINAAGEATETVTLEVVAPLEIASPQDQSVLPGAVVDAPYSVTFTATGGQEPLSWALEGQLPSGLAFDSEAATVSGTPTEEGAFPLVVRVTDRFAPAQTATSAVTLNVELIVPPLLFPDQPLPAGQVGTPYAETLQAEGGLGPYTWEVSDGALPPGVALNADGSLSGTPSEAGSFAFTVTVGDTRDQSASQAFEITVAPPELLADTPEPPLAVLGEPYTYALTARGGTPPYAWSVVLGEMPPGLSLSPDGVISGTPTQRMIRLLSLQVTDTSDPAQTADTSMAIEVVPAQLAVNPVIPPDATVGEAFTYTFSAVGGQTPYTWAVVGGELPPGLTLGADGTLSGTPTEPGTWAATVQVTDNDGVTVTTEATITVDPSALVIVTETLPDGTVNTPYLGVLAGEGGVAPYTWSVTLGDIPGLSLGADGRLTGTPTQAGDYLITIQAQDSVGTTQSSTFGVSISAEVLPLRLVTENLPAAELNVPYDAPLTSTGGVGPYRWEVISGVLPPGLSLVEEGANARITGTPNTTGFYSFTVRVVDNENATASAAFALDITEPPGPTDGVHDGVLGGFIDISATGTLLATASDGDDAVETADIGFDFTLFGTTSSTLTVSSNGFASLDPGASSSPSNATIPSVSGPGSMIAPFWDDLAPNVAGDIYIETRGVAPNRFCVVQWKDVAYYLDAADSAARMNFELILYEATQAVQLIYGPSTNSTSANRHLGASATVGIENADETVGVELSFNSPNAALPGQAWLLTPDEGGGYTIEGWSVVSGRFENIANTGTELTEITTDDDAQSTPIGFDFAFYGQTFATVTVSSNGLLTFGDNPTSASTFINTTIPNTNAPNGFVAPLWDDMKTYTLIDDGPELRGKIHTQVIGEAPRRRFIAQWSDMRYLGDNDSRITFQAVLYETSNHISVHYGPMKANSDSRLFGGSATVGIESPDGSQGVEVSHNGDAVRQGGAVFITPDTATTGSAYTATALSDHFVDIQNAVGVTRLDISDEDDAFVNVPLGFTFPYYGVDYTSISVSTNGFAALGDGLASSYITNTALPTNGQPENTLAVFWDDMNPGSVADRGGIYVATLGAAPDRVFVVQWQHIIRFADTQGSLTYQIVLRETDGAILYNYGGLLDGTTTDYYNQSTATVGFENADGSDGNSFGFDQVDVVQSGGQLRILPR